MKHIVITGGHHNSALVVARELVKRGHKVSWIGHRYASSGDTVDSAEYLEVKSARIPFYNLEAGKLGKSAGLRNLLQIPLGLFRALSLLRSLCPSAVLSFGGYLGASVGLTAVLLRKPLYLHEQTVVAGKANQLLSRFAKRVFLTWPSSLNYFSQSNTTVIGLPLRKSLLKASRLSYFDNALPTLVVMGGKQGSHALNTHLLAYLPQLLSKYNIIHQTGTSSVTGDYKRALQARKNLDKNLHSRYLVHGYIGEEEIGTVLGSADLYLGRSGAHITYELALLGLPSVLVPYLLTHGAEQLQNARFLEQAGLAGILSEATLSWQTLNTALAQASSTHPRPLPLPRDASTRIVKLILHDLEGRVGGYNK